MAAPRAGQVPIRLRLRIANPVPGVRHSLQLDDRPLDPQESAGGEALAFALEVRVARKPGGGFRYFGPQVRSEGKERQFVYVRVGQAAGQCLSPWSRRMKIDVHAIDGALVEAAMACAVLEGTFDGTASDGSPACATIKPVSWRVV